MKVAGIQVLAVASLLGSGLAGNVAMLASPSGQDLRLTYRSAIDDTDQPYRLYVPTVYDGTRPFPLVIAMHGTGGNENSLFDDKRLPPGELKRVAEKHAVLLVSPHGRGTTEYRGIGENDIFCVLADLQRRYRIDPERIYLTGQSMGGTGSAYLALRHPDLFAAAAPLAAAYSFPWLAQNTQHVPLWWIQGAKDAQFYLEGVSQGVTRMRELGQTVRYDLIPGEEHPAGLVRIDAAIEWLVQHRRMAHPREYVFAIDTPLHGRAYWTDVDALEVPGHIGVVRARAEGDRNAHLQLENVSDITFFPDPSVFDLAQSLHVNVNGTAAFSGVISPDRQLRLVRQAGGWKPSLEVRRAASLTGYRTHPVATAPEALDNSGIESRLANWIADAMRNASSADVALYNRVHDRGRGIPAGTVDIVDLIQCSLPFDQHLVVTVLTGKDLLEILNANVPDLRQLTAPSRPMHRLLQVSGLRYTFDPTRPAGERVVKSDVQPERVYRVVLEGQAVQRETVALAGRFKHLKYEQVPASFTMALYGHAARHRKIESRIEGRVRQVN